MPHLPDPVIWSIPAFLLLLALEFVSFRLFPDDGALGFDGRDTGTSMAMGLGSLGWNLLWAVPQVAAFAWLYDHAPWHVPSTLPTMVAVIVAYDFFYYWEHRAHHVIRVLWAAHVVHHSSERFNLSTALRQPWTGFTGWLFYIPLAAAGVHPAVIAFAGGIDLVYQFWIHTERIDKMWRPFEFLFNTPSHHRVHHGSQGSYLDRNYGGVLIVWDRIFRTFTPETERVVYGLTTNIKTHNPLRVAYHEYLSIGRALRTRTTWRDRADTLVHGPGWEPETAR